MLFLSKRVTLVSIYCPAVACLFAELMLSSPATDSIGGFGCLLTTNDAAFVCC